LTPVASLVNVHHLRARAGLVVPLQHTCMQTWILYTRLHWLARYQYMWLGAVSSLFCGLLLRGADTFKRHENVVIILVLVTLQSSKDVSPIKSKPYHEDELCAQNPFFWLLF